MQCDFRIPHILKGSHVLMHCSGVDLWKGLYGITVLRTLNFTFFFFLNGIHSMQDQTATTRHEITRKEAQKKIAGYRKSI